MCRSLLHELLENVRQARRQVTEVGAHLELMEAKLKLELDELRDDLQELGRKERDHSEKGPWGSFETVLEDLDYLGTQQKMVRSQEEEVVWTLFIH